jgi:hypothetical protein
MYLSGFCNSINQKSLLFIGKTVGYKGLHLGSPAVFLPENLLSMMVKSSFAGSLNKLVDTPE